MYSGLNPQLQQHIKSLPETDSDTQQPKKAKNKFKKLVGSDLDGFFGDKTQKPAQERTPSPSSRSKAYKDNIITPPKTSSTYPKKNYSYAPHYNSQRDRPTNNGSYQKNYQNTKGEYVPKNSGFERSRNENYRGRPETGSKLSRPNSRSFSREKNSGPAQTQATYQKKSYNLREFALGKISSEDAACLQKLEAYLESYKDIEEWKAHEKKIDDITNDIIQNKQSAARNEHDIETRKALSAKKKELEEQRKVFENFIEEAIKKTTELSSIYKDVKKNSPAYHNYHNTVINLLRSISVELSRLKLSLPIYAHKNKLQKHLCKVNVCLLSAETGSGKSTQIPQYLLDIANGMKILVIQPRKLATINLAERIREELQDSSLVEYKVYPNTTFTSKSQIHFVTDRIFLNDVLTGFDFSKYAFIFVDEAHERNMNTDVLLGLMKETLKKHRHVKLIVTSATLDKNLFNSYFDCEIFEVPGRLYPVNVKYRPISGNSNFANDIIALIGNKVEKKIKKKIPSKFDNNILIFTAGVDEINNLARDLKIHFSEFYNILPLHGRLTPREQQAVFKPSSQRKIIIATRIAETAITIPDVSVVIDSGYDRETVYDPVKRMSFMEMMYISKSSAKQRAGRAGRTTAGVCYRLYSEEDYNELVDFKTPEIKRSNLDHIILKLKRFNIHKVKEFDFIEKPDEKALDEAIDTLMMLDCLDKNEKITKLGEIVTFMPTDPTISRILYQAVKTGCEQEVSKIVSLINNAGNLFYRGYNDENKHLSDLKKFGFIDETGDLLTFLKVFEKFEEIKRANHFKIVEWAQQNKINLKVLYEAYDTLNELQSSISKMQAALGKISLSKSPCENLGSISEIDLRQEDELLEGYQDEVGMDIKPKELPREKEAIDLKLEGRYAEILKCFLIGYFQNICFYSGNPNLGYTLLRDMKNIKLHGSSALALQGKLNYKWLICTEISKNYYVNTKIASAIDESWIEQLIPKDYLAKYNINNLKKKPIYQSIMMEDMSNAVLYQFVDPNTKIQRIIDEYNVFFDANREKLILEIWSNSGKMKEIKAKVDELIENFKASYAHATFEKKFQGRTVAVIEAGGVIREYLLPNETRQIRFKREGANSLEKYRAIFADFNKFIEDITYFGVDKSAKITFTSKKGIKIIQNHFKFEAKDKLNLLHPESTSKKECLSLINILWFTGCSSGTGFVKFKSALDAHHVRKHMNHQTLGISETSQGSQVYCRIKQLRPENVIFHNLPVNMNEFELEEAIRMQGYITTFLHSHIYRDTNDLYYKQLDDDFNDILEAKLKSLIEPYFDEKDDLVKVEVHPRLPQGDFNEYKRRATLIVKKIHHAQKIKDALNGKDGIIPGSKIYFLPAYEKMYKMAKENYYPCKDMYLKVLKELENRFGTSIVAENTFENPDFRSKIARKYKTRDLDFVMIKIKTDHAFQINEAIRLFNTILLPKKFQLKDRDSSEILYDFKLLKKLVGDLRISFYSNPKFREIEIYGEPHYYEQFVKKLQNYLDNPDFSTEIIKFRGKCITMLMANKLSNFNNIKSNFKDLKITLDLAKREIVIKGNSSRVDKAKADLEFFITDQMYQGQKSDCEICLSKISNKFSLITCGHKFCSDCIREFCIQKIDSITPEKKFEGICCPSNSCNQALYLSDLRAILDNAFLLKLYKVVSEQSVHYFTNLKHCPTPDCPQIYEDDEQVFECDVCAISYCKQCTKAAHIGIDCDRAEYERAMLDPELRHKLGIKKCPRCDIDIQKKDGCAHMKCPCGTHFCWFCTKGYSSAEKCVEHIGLKHRNENHGIPMIAINMIGAEDEDETLSDVTEDYEDLDERDAVDNDWMEA